MKARNPPTSKTSPVGTLAAGFIFIIMHSFIFTKSDRKFLRITALERFCGVCRLPEGAILIVTLGGYLLITVRDRAHIKPLIKDADWLKSRAALILGVSRISIWFAESEVWSESVKSKVVSEVSTQPGKAMINTILERPIETEGEVGHPTPKRSSLVPVDQVAGKMVEALGGDRASWISDILSSLEVFEFNGVQMVRPGDTDAIVDAAADRLKAQLRLPLSMPPDTNGNQAEIPTTKKPVATRKTTAAKRTAPKKAS